MHKFSLLAATLLATTAPHTAWAADEASSRESNSGEKAAQAAPAKKAFSTGVAKGRDLLDTAISASVIDETDLAKLSVTSVSGIIQNIPGIRSLTSDVDGFSSITVRGLPLAADGSKFIQLQEDGLPVLEFNDIQFSSGDRYLRADLNISQIQSIRGGSASTFASNSPGGVINLISKTGEVEGGTIQASAGIGYDLKRLDFEYGAHMGEDWRFHLGGFFREGEGPRNVGFTAFRGGQIKFNATRSFSGGYIRVYGKYLDDRQPNYGSFPVSLTGTDEKPIFASIPGTQIKDDSLLAPLTAQYLGTDEKNQPTRRDDRDGLRAKALSLGLETQFEVSEWTVSNKFRFSDMEGEHNEVGSMIAAPTEVIATILGGPGSTLRYASGPNAGTVILPGSNINGNGLAQINVVLNMDQKSLNYWVDDLRTSRVFDIKKAKVTLSLGVYNSSQEIESDWNFTNRISDLVGGGRTAPLDLTSADGTLLTQNGVYSYGFGFGSPRAFGNYSQYLNYRIVAPYGSINVAAGKLSVGGSVRYDRGSVSGRIFSGESIAAVDVDGNGMISPPEAAVAIVPLNDPVNVDYKYGYLSFSTGVNYRVAESLAAFARYSRGGRAGADRVLGSLDATSGKLRGSDLAFGAVTQAEAGLKFRQGGVTVYVTGFWAATKEQNTQIAADSNGMVIVVDVVRKYSAKGVELEAELRKGPFSMTLGGTWTKARIDADSTSASLTGNTPRYIPTFSFQARPSFDVDRFSVGAVINGTTSSFAQDTNFLKLPGYVIVSPYAQFRVTDKLALGVNAFNVLDKTAFYAVSTSAVTATGITNAQMLNGRTVTGSLRYSF